MDCRKIVDDLAAVNRRIAEAVGDDVTGWTPAVRDSAEHVVAGDVYRFPDGRWVRVDFDRVDWDGRATDNPDTLVMVMRRFHFLHPLMAGFRAEGDERYAQAARRYIEAFLRDDPPRADWTPVRLDAATQYEIRAAIWLTALGEFRNSPVFDEPFMALVIEAVRGYMRHLSNHIWPDRNIRVLHGQTLLMTGVRLADLPESAAWRAQGLTIVNDALRRQILPDGAHMEATPGYHGGMLSDFQTLWRLGRAMPELGIRASAARVAGMHDYLLAATRPDGAVISLHDTRYTRATIPPRTAVREARALFRRDAGLPDALPPPRVGFPYAGQAFIRDDWSTGTAYLTFDAAPRRSYHWHPGRNSVTLFAHGRALLTDPGYTFDSPTFPRYGHRTAHHNTVNFNGWDQSRAPALFRFTDAGDYALAEGLYGGGYWPLAEHSHGAGMFGEHARALLWIRGRFGVVLDHVHHTAVAGVKPAIESCWQFSEGPIALDPTARRVLTRHARGNLLLAFPVVLPGSTLTVHEGERDPMRGWLPVEWGRQCIPAPLVRLTAPAVDPWHGDLAAVLVPFEGPEPPVLSCSGTGPDLVADSRLAGCLRLAGSDGAGDLVAWTRRLEHAIDRQHGLHTDAALVHLRLDAAGAVTGGLMVDGTACAFDGRDVTDRLTVLDRLAGGQSEPCG